MVNTGKAMVVGLGLGCAGFLASSVAIFITENNTLNKRIKDASLSVKDSTQIQKAVDKGTISWDQALDSISISKKAYFEGAQAVRDSIAKAAKAVR